MSIVHSLPACLVIKLHITSSLSLGSQVCLEQLATVSTGKISITRAGRQRQQQQPPPAAHNAYLNPLSLLLALTPLASPIIHLKGYFQEYGLVSSSSSSWSLSCGHCPQRSRFLLCPVRYGKQVVLLKFTGCTCKLDLLGLAGWQSENQCTVH